MTDIENAGKRQRFVPNKAMKKNYPEGNFKVVGEFEKKKPLSEDEGTAVILSNGETVYVRNAGYYKKSRYRVYGYILTENEDEFVAVIENVSWKFGLLALFMALIIGIGGYFIWQMNQGPDLDPALKDYVADLKRPEGLDKTRILVPSYSEFLMNADTDTLSANLFNPDGNPCFFQYTIVLADKGTVLYKSKLVPPGKAIQDPTLTQTMKQGTYKIIVRIKSYDLNDYKTEFNGAEIPTTLKALK